MVTREMKISEAVKRMHRLHIMEQVVSEFEKYQKREYSEHTKLGGILYWIDNEPEWAKMVQEFEDKHNALVYHAIHCYTEFGELLSLLYVSDEQEEWEYDWEDIDDGYVMTYTINLTDPWCSEFGSIAVREVAGGLIRVG